MTLQASGSMTGANIRDELRQSGGSLVFPSATTRWLADKPSGNLVLPNDYYNKTAIKQVSTIDTRGASTSSFSGTMTYGPDFPGRWIICCVCCMASGGSSILVNALSLSGITAAQGSGWNQFDGSMANTQGIAWANPTGTSGTYVVTMNRAATDCFIRVYSVSNLGGTSSGNSNGQNSTNNVFTTINTPSNSIIIAAGFQRDYAGGTYTFTGATKNTEIVLGYNAWYGTAITNRIGVQAGRSMGVSNSGGAISFMSTAAQTFGG